MKSEEFDSFSKNTINNFEQRFSFFMFKVVLQMCMCKEDDNRHRNVGKKKETGIF